MGNDYTDPSTVIGYWPWGTAYTVAKATYSNYCNRMGLTNNIRNQTHFDNIKLTFETVMLPFAQEFGRDFTMNSHYRGYSGASTSSGHYSGLAVDLGFKSSDSLNMMLAFSWVYAEIDYYQLIFEFPTESQEHLHVHIRPDRSSKKLTGVSRSVAWANHLGITHTPVDQTRGIYSSITANSVLGLETSHPEYWSVPGKMNFIP